MYISIIIFKHVLSTADFFKILIHFLKFVEKFKETMRKPMEMTFVMGNLGDNPPAIMPIKKPDAKNKTKILSQLAKLGDDGDKDKEGQLPGESKKLPTDCKHTAISHNVTLKGSFYFFYEYVRKRKKKLNNHRITSNIRSIVKHENHCIFSSDTCRSSTAETERK